MKREMGFIMGARQGLVEINNFSKEKGIYTMLSKEYFKFEGTKDISYWVIDQKDKLAVEIAEYVGRFCTNDGSAFTVTEKSDVAFIVITKKNQITGVFFEDTPDDNGKKVYVRFVGKMALAFRVDSNYAHYKILFAEIPSEKECRGLVFESCGYEANEIPFDQVYNSFKLLAAIPENGIVAIETDEVRDVQIGELDE